MRRWILRGLVAVILVLGALAILGSRGTYQEYSRQDYSNPAKRGEAPRWVSVCADTPGLSWLHCGRVKGRVAWIQRRDSDGDGDVHFAVVSRLRLRIVKIQPKRHLREPGIGQSFTATGPVFRGQSGRAELDAVHIR